MAVIVDLSVPSSAVTVSELLPTGATVSLEYEPRVPIGEMADYVWIDGPDREDAVVWLESTDGVESSVLERSSDSILVRIEWARLDRTLFDTVEGTGGILLSGKTTTDGWNLTVAFPGSESGSAFYEACADASIPVSIQEIHQNTNLEDGGDDLSDAQRATIQTALEAGYFEVPLETTISELAPQLGISQQAVSERLRRGLAALIDTTALSGDGDRVDSGADERYFLDTDQDETDEDDTENP